MGYVLERFWTVDSEYIIIFTMKPTVYGVKLSLKNVMLSGRKYLIMSWVTLLWISPCLIKLLKLEWFLPSSTMSNGLWESFKSTFSLFKSLILIN